MEASPVASHEPALLASTRITVSATGLTVLYQPTQGETLAECVLLGIIATPLSDAPQYHLCSWASRPSIRDMGVQDLAIVLFP